MKKVTAYKAFTCLGVLALLSATIFVAVRWSAMPESVPTHFGGDGVADAYGQKSSIFLPLIMGWLIFGMCSLLGLIPVSAWNTPQNVVRPIKVMLGLLNLIIALDFAYMLVCIVLCTDLGRWNLPVFMTLLYGDLAAIVITVIVGAIKSRRQS